MRMRGFAVPDAKRKPQADLHIRAPARLLNAVAQAANKNMTTSSEYIRQAILDRLKGEDRSLAAKLTEA
jgi:hypothetical protein